MKRSEKYITKDALSDRFPQRLEDLQDRFNNYSNIEYDFEFLSDNGIKECEKNNYTALSEEAFEELMTL